MTRSRKGWTPVLETSSDRMSEIVSERASEGVSESVPERVPERVLNGVSSGVPKRVPTSASAATLVGAATKNNAMIPHNSWIQTTFFGCPFSGFSFLGFSLIELLVVLAMIGILTAVALPSYNHYRVQALQGQAVVALEMLATRQARYRLITGFFGEADAINAQALVSADLRQHYDLAVDVVDEGHGYEMRLSPKVLRPTTPVLRIDHTGWRDPVGAWHR